MVWETGYTFRRGEEQANVKLKNLHKQYNLIENTLQVKDFLTEEEEFRRLKEEEAIKDGIVREDG
jgi:hypothetical protein